jgi:hypothetical protein
MVFSNNLLLGAVSAAAGDYLIEQSLCSTARRTCPAHLRWLATVRLGRLVRWVKRSERSIATYIVLHRLETITLGYSCY